jgi:phospholipid transport system substrate-binding protein
MTSRRFIIQLMSVFAVAGAIFTPTIAIAADMAPDAMIKFVSNDVMDAIKKDKSIVEGDLSKISQLVDNKVITHVNFKRMTSSAVGPAWNKTTPEQQLQLQNEFKVLLVRIYSGALSQISDQTIAIKPVRMSAEDLEVIVKTEVRGRGDPIPLEYRLEKTPGVGLGWKIYNFNVNGIWMMETYRSQFAQEINARGVEGLIASLKDRNTKAAALKK